MAVELRVPDSSLQEALVQLRLARSPRSHRSQVEWPFVHANELEMFKTRAAYVSDELVGWAGTVRGKWFPPGMAMINVTVARAHERQGVGGALLRAMVHDLPDEISMIGSAVDDAETRSLDVARAWGFEINQHGIESELALVDLPTPEAGPGVTFEDVSSLEFDDEEAVEAMLIDSQTNPEAAEGFVSRLANYREIAAKVERPASALARVDGVPAAIIVGEVQNGVLGIAYTGVGRAFRGRGLAFGLKQYGHLLAAEAGATVCHTMNEESNAGIRHVNEKLGYRVIGGVYRLRARRELLS
jgi:GNAT superfamily N-acetyltransferase